MLLGIVFVLQQLHLNKYGQVNHSIFITFSGKRINCIGLFISWHLLVLPHKLLDIKISSIPLLKAIIGW